MFFIFAKSLIFRVFIDNLKKNEGNSTQNLLDEQNSQLCYFSVSKIKK
jgi:hypothetical protein